MCCLINKMSAYVYRELSKLTNENIQEYMCVRGRVYKIRVTAKICFLILRQNITILQCIAIKKDDINTYDNYKKVILE
jgi:aspartyl/asparaginyl-tRNA synthetase